jgi:hypothetical protein
MNINLHLRLGINPRLTCCPHCKRDGNDIVLLGAANYVVDCSQCGTKVYGGINSARGGCPKCKSSHAAGINRRELDDSERLMTSTCECCRAAAELAENETQLVEFSKALSDGGILFKCKSCDFRGIIKAEAALAKKVREELKVEAPKVCGVEFDTCDQHQVKADV